MTIPDRLALSLEFTVGVVLVILGIPLIRQLVVGGAHIHRHQHGDGKHLHSHSHKETHSHDHRHIRRLLLLGMVHGFRGEWGTHPASTEYYVLDGSRPLLSLGIWCRLYLGYVALHWSCQFPLSSCRRDFLALEPVDSGSSGAVSIIFGLFIMWGAGYVDGLFFSTT